MSFVRCSWGYKKPIPFPAFFFSQRCYCLSETSSSLLSTTHSLEINHHFQTRSSLSSRPDSMRFFVQLKSPLLILSNMVLLEAQLHLRLRVSSRSLDLAFVPSETPSATSWPSSLKGGFKIRIIRSQIRHVLPREKEHDMISV